MPFAARTAGACRVPVGALAGPPPWRYASFVAIVLPPSLRRELHSVEDEVAWARALTPSQRLEVLAALCRDSLILLGMNPHAERILAHRDPVPPSTVAALRRLRVRSEAP